MTRDLTARVAAAQAAADADRIPRCVFCTATDQPLVPWSEHGWPAAMACAATGACHERFVRLNAIVGT